MWQSIHSPGLTVTNRFIFAPYVAAQIPSTGVEDAKKGPFAGKNKAKKVFVRRRAFTGVKTSLAGFSAVSNPLRREKWLLILRKKTPK